MISPTAEFDDLDRTLAASGPSGAIDRLIRVLDDRKDYRALLDALLLKARHDLGLPPLAGGSLGDLPEPSRTAYEERYIESIRSVGSKLLEAGDIGAAWAYFRAIAEKEPVARAIDAFAPEPDDERLGQVVEVAFNQGVHPRKGFDLILDHYGTCSAITAFDSLPPDASPRIHAADRLTRRLHDDLAANLRAEIARRGQPLPPEGAPIARLIEGRGWLFADDAYHLDVSHLASTIRLSPLLEDPATIALALDLTEYGRRLSDRHRYEGDPPFEAHYEDHALYLGALLGRDVDAAIAHFRAKLPDLEGGAPPRDDAIAAQVLVRLLDRLARPAEALEVAVERLAHLPDSALGCPRGRPALPDPRPARSPGRRGPRPRRPRPVHLGDPGPPGPGGPRSMSDHAFSEAERAAVYRAILERRDCRHFVPGPIGQDILGRLLLAAHHAPSVGFMQPWNFVVIRSVEVRTLVKSAFERANRSALAQFGDDRSSAYQALKLEGILDSDLNLCITCDRSEERPGRPGPDVPAGDGLI